MPNHAPMVDEMDLASWPDRRNTLLSKRKPRDRRHGADRRSHRRLRLTLEIALPVRLRTPEGVLRGLARNISEGGMLIEVSERPPIGTDIHVTIAGVSGSLDAPEALTLSGEVRHHFSWQYAASGQAEIMRAIGVRFTEERDLEADLCPSFHWNPNTTIH